MRLLFVFFIFLHYLAAPINAEVIGDKSFKDTDWNVPMWNWNNDYLHGQDIEWINVNGDKALQFTLVGGMPGIRDDAKPTDYGPLFKERNELHSHYLKENINKIELKFRMTSGFKTRHENFFQVHTYNNSCKTAKPPLMLVIHKGQFLAVSRGSDQLDRVRTYFGVSRKQLIGSWQDLVVSYTRVDEDYLRFNISSGSLGIDKTLPDSRVMKCGTPYVKFGIYRPSKADSRFKMSLNKVNPTSVIQFDDLQIIEGKY